MKLFEQRKVKGAVSIFLIIVLIPTMLLSAVLIDGSRLASARAMTQEASDLAALSVLTDYDQMLKDSFGLFALRNTDEIESIYRESLENTLMAYGISGDSAYSEQIWDILKTAVTAQKSYAGENFLNLYDFSVDQTSVQAKFPLAEKEVLESQMVEYAKFRGIYVMADRMDILSNLGQMKEEARKNQEAGKAMEEKMDVDEKNGAIETNLADLREKLGTLNASIQQAELQIGSYLNVLPAYMKQIRLEYTDTEETLTEEEQREAQACQTLSKSIKNVVQSTQKNAKLVLDQAKVTKKSIEEGVQRLETYQTENRDKGESNETIGALVEDAAQNSSDYQKVYLPMIQELLDDGGLNALAEKKSVGSDTEKAIKKIDAAIKEYQKDIEEQRRQAETSEEEDAEDAQEPLEITEYEYYYLDLSDSTQDEDQVIYGGADVNRYYAAAVQEPMSSFFGRRWNENINPTESVQTSERTQKIDEEFAAEQSEKTETGEGAGGNPVSQGEVPEDIYRIRPSKTYVSEAGNENESHFFNRTGDLTAIKNVMSKGQDSILLQIGEAARDDVLCLSYMFGTFKTRLTGVEKFSSEGMSEADKNSFYMPKWRYAHPDGELDMRFSPKKDRSTVLRSEIEYLVYGNRTDAANEAAVYATIMGERLINNFAAMYMDKKVVNPSCHAAAALTSAAIGFLVPETVFFWIYLAAWATAETLIEMDYLISGGYKIPVFKTPSNLLLNTVPTSSGEGLISNYGQSGIFVSYEDYLLFFLLAKGSEKRVMRTADLIEMNMRKNGASNFSMSKAFTTIHADSELSIRYLFGNVMPFQKSYEENGYSGRIRYSNTIDQSY